MNSIIYVCAMSVAEDGKLFIDGFRAVPDTFNTGLSEIAIARHANGRFEVLCEESNVTPKGLAVLQKLSRELHRRATLGAAG